MSFHVLVRSERNWEQEQGSFILLGATFVWLDINWRAARHTQHEVKSDAFAEQVAAVLGAFNYLHANVDGEPSDCVLYLRPQLYCTAFTRRAPLLTRTSAHQHYRIPLHNGVYAKRSFERGNKTAQVPDAEVTSHSDRKKACVADYDLLSAVAIHLFNHSGKSLARKAHLIAPPCPGALRLNLRENTEGENSPVQVGAVASGNGGFNNEETRVTYLRYCFAHEDRPVGDLHANIASLFVSPRRKGRSEGPDGNIADLHYEGSGIVRGYFKVSLPLRETQIADSTGIVQRDGGVCVEFQHTMV
jgi:hypothetical protein